MLNCAVCLTEYREVNTAFGFKNFGFHLNFLAKVKIYSLSEIRLINPVGRIPVGLSRFNRAEKNVGLTSHNHFV